MKRALCIESIRVESAGKTYKKGKEYEISEALFNRHKGKHFEEVKPKVVKQK